MIYTAPTRVLCPRHPRHPSLSAAGFTAPVSVSSCCAPAAALPGSWRPLLFSQRRCLVRAAVCLRSDRGRGADRGTGRTGRQRRTSPARHKDGSVDTAAVHFTANRAPRRSSAGPDAAWRRLEQVTEVTDVNTALEQRTGWKDLPCRTSRLPQPYRRAGQLGGNWPAVCKPVPLSG